jgi:hypothetical protein
MKGDLNVQASRYANMCNPQNIVWDANQLTIDQIRAADFTPRPPLRVKLCGYGY